ncbi:MAG: hypothetical protein R2867_30125 [Caldilineaceae bacterium]
MIDPAQANTQCDCRGRSGLLLGSCCSASRDGERLLRTPLAAERALNLPILGAIPAGEVVSAAAESTPMRSGIITSAA